MTDKILIERSVVEQVMNWLSIINEPSAVKHVMRLEDILGAALEQPPRQPLTDDQIQEAATKAVHEHKLSWLWFRKDEHGHYTIPELSQSNYQFARAIEAAHGIKE